MNLAVVVLLDAVLPIFHVVSAPTSPVSGPARPSRVALWAVLLYTASRDAGGGIAA